MVLGGFKLSVPVEPFEQAVAPQVPVDATHHTLKRLADFARLKMSQPLPQVLWPCSWWAPSRNATCKTWDGSEFELGSQRLLVVANTINNSLSQVGVNVWTRGVVLRGS